LEPCLQCGLLFAEERGKIGYAGITRPPIEAGNGFTMEPVRCPIRRDVGTMAPDGADLLSPQGLPDALPTLYGTAIKEHLPVRADDMLRDWRHLRDRPYPDAAEHGE
jgi:hypothetical protein